MKRILSRRAFLQGSAAAAGGLLVAKTVLLNAQPFPRAVAPSDRVRFGMIGIGMQGSGLLAGAITIPGVECVGAADLYDGRHTLAKEITGNPSLPTTPSLSGIARPQGHRLHRGGGARSLAQARRGGRLQRGQGHLLREAHVAQRGRRTRDGGGGAKEQSHRADRLAARQFRALRQGRELYKGGAIGDVEMVELTLGRNDPTGAWEYPPPSIFRLQTLDWDTWLNDAPKIPFNNYHFARWRCWREYGTGVGGRPDGAPHQRHARHAGVE